MSEFEVIVDGEAVAVFNGDEYKAMREAMHYAETCSDGGHVVINSVTRSKVFEQGTPKQDDGDCFEIE